MFKRTQDFLDRLTMYKLILIGLRILAAAALVLSYFGVLSYASTAILSGMLAILLITCTASNYLLGKLYRLPVHHESAIITALILFFVLAAPSKPYEWVGIVFAGIVAMASKYIVIHRGAAIFNPAAFGVLAASLLGIGYGSWWIARPELFIPVFLVGLMILAKLRRFELFGAFFFPALFLVMFSLVGSDTNISQAFVTAVTLYPLVFLGTVMLTEPGTMPATRNKRLIYGGIVGLVLGSQLDAGFFSASPHAALLIGNVFTLVASRRVSTRMKFVGKIRMSPTTYDFAFEPDRKVAFIPGQYIELTLPGIKTDNRGQRRTFTVASSPDDKYLHFGIKFSEPGSWFKKKMLALTPGSEIVGNHVAGDFVLPGDSKIPVVFVAGGIGITPFISMMRSLFSDSKTRDITLYYFAHDTDEIVYKDVLKKARAHGIKVVLQAGTRSELSDKDIRSHGDAYFYIAGPPGLVGAYKARLSNLRVKRIIVDYFTGY